MAEWDITGHPDGTITLGRAKTKIQEYLRKQDHPVRMKLVREEPESGAMRRFYHGAIVPLWVFLDGNDYRDHRVLADYNELAKLEFNSTVLIVNGEPKKVGRSTKGSAVLGPHVERVISYLEENYGIDRTQCLNSDDYKHFIETVYMHGAYETYIDYLIELKRVPQTTKEV